MSQGNHTAAVPRLLDAQDVAEILRCSRSQVYALRSSGELPASVKLFRGDRGWRWTFADVGACIARHTLAGPAVNRTEASVPAFVPVPLTKAGV